MKRACGVLLPVTSLPSRYGIGCFSQSAYDFVDLLAKAGQTYWQILPLGPASHDGACDSPYQAYSAFAGNPYLISPEALVKEGLLTEKECAAADFGSDAGRVDYDKLSEHRLPLLRLAFSRAKTETDEDYQQFVGQNDWWLDDYALFMAVRDFFGGVAWIQWPEDIRRHWGFALDYYREKLRDDVAFHKFLQFKFFRQWSALKDYANRRHIRIVGDIPIYVSPDGSDVWAHPELFQLDENNRSLRVAGCPPDDFSADGQLWGNPLYRWDRHRETGYDWWVSRIWHSFRLYDVVRIDHFRGLDEYYAIPVDKTAKEGSWEPGPGMELFHAIRHHLGDCSIIAEDLGHMTDSVRRLVRDSGFPNMKVLQFAFDPADEGGANEHLPHNCPTNCVVYTGTHDNNTITGWYNALTGEERAWVRTYLDRPELPDGEMPRELIRTALMSAADTCIIPFQDWLGLDSSARVNTPGTTAGNWSWRLTSDLLPKGLAEEMLTLAKRYGRANWDALHLLKEKSAKE